jgi:predicted permease
MSVWFHDVRFACRLLLRQPAFSGVAILTLALGIAAATAVFSVVYGVLLRPLPYRDPDRLVMLHYGHQGRVSPWLSPSNFGDYVAQSGVFNGAAAIAPIIVNLTGSGDPERLSGAKVSWNFFDVLGASMALGRGFNDADTRGDGSSIVLSYGLWRRRFGARPDIINTTATIDGRTMTVVGVASADLRFPAAAEFWQPLIFTPRDVAPEARGAQWVQVVTRLRDGVSQQQATTALETVAGRLARAYPQTETDATIVAVALHERIVGNTRPTLLLLLGAVMLVMLIACANVANLLLARAHGRGREMAVRAALGASRLQLVRQLLIESLILGVVGTIAGASLALLPVRALVVLAPSSIPRLSEVTIDGHILAFAAAAAVITSLVFGLVPALSASRGLSGAGSSLSRGAVGEAGRRPRRWLAVSELALAVMLLAGAGLLIRSYIQLLRVAPGFDPEGVVTFSLSMPAAKYSESGALNAFVSTLISRLQGEPGVASASAAMGLPFTSDLNALTGFRREGQPEPDSASMPSASLRIITADYFRTLKIPLRGGRFFTDRDTLASPDVALINERAAQRYFAGVNPIGEQIRVSAELSREGRNGPKTIVGVVGNVKYRGLDEETPAEIYLPFGQNPVGAFTVAVRTRGDGAALVPALRHEVAALDPLLPLANVKLLEDLVDASVAGRRFTLAVFLLFGGIAVVLSAVGVYGVLAFLVGQRTREIGLRLAIGASPAAVVWLFVREGASLIAIGVTAGLAGSLAAGRWIAALLFGVTAADPATFVAAVLTLAMTAACAIYVPARRAARVDPSDALRSD